MPLNERRRAISEGYIHRDVHRAQKQRVIVYIVSVVHKLANWQSFKLPRLQKATNVVLESTHVRSALSSFYVRLWYTAI